MQRQWRLLAIGIVGFTVFSQAGCTSDGRPLDAKTVSSTVQAYSDKSKAALEETVQQTEVTYQRMLNKTDQAFDESGETLRQVYERNVAHSKHALDRAKRLSTDAADKIAEATRASSDKAEKMLGHLKN